MLKTSFRHLETGPLVDDELELVEPAMHLVDDHYAALRDPLTQQCFPEQGRITRQQLVETVQHAPRGRYYPNNLRGILPAYLFWMRLRPTGSMQRIPLVIAGSISLRCATNHDVEHYLGHIGYHIYPAARGHHYAERAARLLLPLARHHELSPLWITCNPDNAASRRTCERLGGSLVDIIPIPQEHPFHQRGERQKCRYRFDL